MYANQNPLEQQYQNSKQNVRVGKNGEYKVIRKRFLDRGGFGIVFVSIKKSKNSQNKPVYEEVVIKEYKKSEKWKNEEDFDKELVVFQRFKHILDNKYLLKIHDIFQDKQNKRYYLVLELAPGGTLFDRIKQQMKEEDIFQFVKRSAQLLYYLHFEALKDFKPKEDEQKDHLSFIHRDFKPANLVYKNKDDQKSMYLIDFGIVKIGYANTPRNYNNCGTSNYKAPQITETRCYNAKVDVYSFGCTLYEVLSGGEKLLGVMGAQKITKEKKEEYVRSKLVDLQYKFSKTEKDKDRDKNKKLNYPNYWLQILNNCLAHDPKYRWSSKDLLQFIKRQDKKEFRKNQKYYFEQFQSPNSMDMQNREKREIYEINFQIYRLNLIQQRIFAIFEYLYFQQPRISKFTLYVILKYVIIFELEKFRKIKDKCKLYKRDEKLLLIRNSFQDKKLQEIKKKAIERMNGQLEKEKSISKGSKDDVGHIEGMIERYPELLNDTAAEPRRTLYEFCYQERNYIMEDDTFSKMVATILIFMDELDCYKKLQVSRSQWEKSDPEILSLKKLTPLKPSIENKIQKEGVKEIYQSCRIEHSLQEGMNKQQSKTDIPIEAK